MIIVDRALQERAHTGRPITLGIAGAGFIAHGLTNQVANSVPGMRVGAIYGRRLERAVDCLNYAGITDIARPSGPRQLDRAVNGGSAAATDDASLLWESSAIDVVVDVTGSVDFGAELALQAFRHGKHVVLLNAELDATIGPILQTYATAGGVRLSACDGDEPALQMNLVRWVRGLGLVPRVLGNVKGLQDPYRNPTTQAEFARTWDQNPMMVTSFADGSKISFEQAVVANATGFVVRSRGMSRGRTYDGPIAGLSAHYDLDELRELGGVVDYLVGPAGAKVFCLAEHADEKQRRYLELYKLGPGPLYAFWLPYHLVHFEAPATIARVALLDDTVAPPLGGPVVEVCAVAKRALSAGEVLDDYGGYSTYGEAVNSEEMRAGRYLPEGLVAGCRLVRDIPLDAVLTYDDVELPPGRLADRLRAEQYEKLSGEDWLARRLELPPDTSAPHTRADRSPQP